MCLTVWLSGKSSTLFQFHICLFFFSFIKSVLKVFVIFFLSSCNLKLNLDGLLEELWEYLALIRVYTKKPGQPPDFDDCLILRRGVTVEHVCHAIHRTLADAFKYALVWVCETLS